ncbi:MAG TPA: TolC family protein [Bacteroidales bacterium]|nr:TolC family protein [Bacteroidales bacterium]HPT20544.1 TolC family protein [Bacteroidales bacterium]
MKNYMIYAVLLDVFLGMQTLAAQEHAGTIPLDQLTLDRAISYALNNSPELNVQRLKQQKDEQELSKIQRDKIPDVYLSGDVRRNLIIPSTPIPASMINPAAAPDQMLYMKFNTDWNSGAGINFSYDIFNPATFRQASEQKIQNKISNFDTKISETDIQADIAQAYAECVISQDQLESLKYDTVFYYHSWKEAIILYQQAKISLPDKNNAVIAYNTSIMQYLNAERVLNAAKAKLLYKMGVEVSVKNTEALHLSEDIPALHAKMDHAEYGVTAGNRVTDSVLHGPVLARQAEVIALSESRIKSAQLKYAPLFSMTCFYGNNYYGNAFNPGDGSLWHGNSYIAVSLKVPLTQAFTTSKEVAQLKLQQQIERENMRRMQNQKSQEWLDARNQLMTSEKEYEMYRQNYEMSAENLKASMAQVDKAYIQDKDYLAEQVRCRNSYQSFLQAAYNVFINKINLQKLGAE